MARNKYPEETVKKILDVSERLFLEKGYDNTTVQDIIDHLGGLTKGVIYHHFKSKEEIFNKVLENKYEVNIVSQLAQLNDKTGFEKIQKINSLTLQSLEHQKIVYSAKSLINNPRIIGDMYIKAFEEVIPYMKTLVDEGIQDGSIKTDYPQEVAELLILTMNIWLGPMLSELDEKQLIKKLHFFKILYESVDFPLIDDQYIKDVVRMLKVVQE